MTLLKVWTLFLRLNKLQKRKIRQKNKLETDDIANTQNIHKCNTHTGSNHSLRTKSQNCRVAALSWHPGFMSALWIQARKQQTASQHSGCWSQAVTLLRPQKWLFVAAWNTAMFPDIKWPEILFLTRVLCDEMKWITSVILSLGIFMSDCESRTECSTGKEK